MHSIHLAHLQGFQTDAVRFKQGEIEPYRVSASYAIGFDTVKLSFRPGVERDVLQLQTNVYSDENLHAFLAFQQHVTHWFENSSPDRLRYVTGEKTLSINGNYTGDPERFLESGTSAFQHSFRPTFLTFLAQWRTASYQKKVASMVNDMPDLPIIFEGFTQPTFTIIGNRHGYLANWIEEQKVGKRTGLPIKMIHTVQLAAVAQEEGIHNFVQYNALFTFLQQHGFILRHGGDVLHRLRQWIEKKR